MLCTKCRQNEANFHIKVMMNGAPTEAHLCESCMRRFGMFDITPGFGNAFDSFFRGSGFLDSMNPATPQYDAPLAGTRQIGFRPMDVPPDVPADEPAMVSIREETALEEKQRLLKEAIAKENYEQAAHLRDEIKALEAH